MNLLESFLRILDSSIKIKNLLNKSVWSRRYCFLASNLKSSGWIKLLNLLVYNLSVVNLTIIFLIKLN